MMDSNNLIITIRSALALFALWFIWYYGFRNYFLDKMRQRLFEIRDRLFDYSADGNIDFNHAAYGNLRLSLNGMLRFAHQLYFSRALLSIVADLVAPNPNAGELLKNHFAPVATLPSPQKEFLTKLHLKMIMVTVT